MSASDCPSNSARLGKSIPCDNLIQGEGFTVFRRDLTVCLALSESREWLAVGCLPHLGERRLENRKSGRVTQLSPLKKRHWGLADVPEVIDHMWISRNSPWRASCTHITIPDTVREICDECFSECSSLRRVTFGPCSSLERLGCGAFSGTAVEEIMIPDKVREICDRCFSWCSNLRRVTFGSSSCLARLGCEAFSGTEVEEVMIPDTVREIRDRCFSGCHGLRRVTFGASSCLEILGCEAFSGTKVEEMMIPDKVSEICDRCFSGCHGLRRITFGSSCSIQRLGDMCFAFSGLEEFWLPRGRVVSIGSKAFFECPLCESSLPCLEGCQFPAHGCVYGRLILSDKCSVCRGLVGRVEEVTIPDTVREICDECFSGCSSLRRVTFGASSTLERLGRRWLAGTQVEEVTIPDTVREICDRCFSGCSCGLRVTFGPSCLERLGRKALSLLKPIGTWVQENVLEFSGIRIFVCWRCGGRVEALTVDPSDTIEGIKGEIQALTGVSRDQQRLMFHFQLLDDRDVIEDCSIQDGSKLFLDFPGCSRYGRSLRENG